MALFCETWIEGDNVQEEKVRDCHGYEEAEVNNGERYSQPYALRDSGLLGRIEDVFNCALSASILWNAILIKPTYHTEVQRIPSLRR